MSFSLTALPASRKADSASPTAWEHANDPDAVQRSRPRSVTSRRAPRNAVQVRWAELVGHELRLQGPLTAATQCPDRSRQIHAVSEVPRLAPTDPDASKRFRQFRFPPPPLHHASDLRKRGDGMREPVTTPLVTAQRFPRGGRRFAEAGDCDPSESREPAERASVLTPSTGCQRAGRRLQRRRP